MQHPFEVLAPEYTQLLGLMRVRPECADELERVVERLLGYQANDRYAEVSAKTGVPQVWMAASFEREASSDFRCSPAQGDRWDRVSVHVPRGRGPFAGWDPAAEDAYHLDGLDAIGASNWVWARAAFEDELFNGFGPRDYHHMHSSYLWGGTNIQQRGKYVRDGVFDPTVMDPQLGTMPIMVRMVQLRATLALADALPTGAAISWPPIAPSIIPAPQPAPAGVGGGDADHGTQWLQQTLNALGQDPPLDDDGSYGRRTRQAVMTYQFANGLDPDGFAGPKTIASLVAQAPKS
jgi:lysozyme family protein